MKLGYIIASHEVTKRGKQIGYLYREEPDNPNDSGWRVFSGEETQEYVDDAKNFSMYNASTIVQLDPLVLSVLAHAYPVSFERDFDNDQFVELSNL